METSQKKPSARRKGHPGRAPAACLVLFLAVGWVCADHLFGTAIRRALTGREASGVEIVIVPELTGKVYADGAAADPAHFDVTVAYMHSREVPAGRVLSQDPPGGARRKCSPGVRKCALRVTVSLGPKTPEIPPLYGTDAREAEIALRDVGLCPEVVPVEMPYLLSDVSRGTQYLGGVRDGCVLAVRPTAGSRVPEGSTVRLYVVEAPATPSVSCPDLYGMTPTEALLALGSAGLRVGQLREVASEDVTEAERDPPAAPETPRDGRYVCGQQIPAGTWVPPGTAVDMTVLCPQAGDPPADERRRHRLPCPWGNMKKDIKQ